MEFDLKVPLYVITSIINYNWWQNQNLSLKIRCTWHFSIRFMIFFTVTHIFSVNMNFESREKKPVSSKWNCFIDKAKNIASDSVHGLTVLRSSKKPHYLNWILFTICNEKRYSTVQQIWHHIVGGTSHDRTVYHRRV